MTEDQAKRVVAEALKALRIVNSRASFLADRFREGEIPSQSEIEKRIAAIEAAADEGIAALSRIERETLAENNEDPPDPEDDEVEPDEDEGRVL